MDSVSSALAYKEERGRRGVEDRERNDRRSFLTSVTSLKDSTGSLAALGGFLATAGELSPDVNGLGDMPGALSIA